MINETFNWKIISELGWGTKTVDYKSLGKKLRKFYSISEIEDFETFVRSKQKYLMTELNRFASKNGNAKTYWGLGDDSFSDLTAHIVGLGKQTYDNVMKNPAIAKSIPFHESFLYIFQHVKG